MALPFFVRKDLGELHEQAKKESGFKRSLGTWELTALGVGFVIGTGIFVLTGHIAAENAGPAVCLAFLLAAVPASLVAACYAEMVSTVPGVGGAYLYVGTSLGELPAFLVGWTLTFTYCVGAATVATGWSSYALDLLQQFFHWEMPKVISATPWAQDNAGHLHATGGFINLPAAAIVMGLSFLLLLGASKSMRFTMALVALKVSVVGLFIVAVGRHVDPALWHPFVPDNTGEFGHFGLSGILQGASLAVFAYLGVDNLSTAVQEAKEPETAVPRAITITMVLCVVLYIAVCLVLTGVVPYAKLNVDDPISIGMHASNNQALEAVVQGGALAGLTSVLLIQLFGLPRIIYAMAQDGLAPTWAGRLGAKSSTPAASTLIMGAIVSTAAAFTPIKMLAEVTAAGTLVTFVCVSAGVAVLRREHPNAERKFRVPGGPYLVPGMAVATCTALFVLAPAAILGVLFAWWALGFSLYVWMRRTSVRKA